MKFCTPSFLSADQSCTGDAFNPVNCIVPGRAGTASSTHSVQRRLGALWANVISTTHRFDSRTTRKPVGDVRVFALAAEGRKKLARKLNGGGRFFTKCNAIRFFAICASCFRGMVKHRWNKPTTDDKNCVFFGVRVPPSYLSYIRTGSSHRFGLRIRPRDEQDRLKTSSACAAW